MHIHPEPKNAPPSIPSPVTTSTKSTRWSTSKCTRLAGVVSLGAPALREALAGRLAAAAELVGVQVRRCAGRHHLGGGGPTGDVPFGGWLSSKAVLFVWGDLRGDGLMGWHMYNSLYFYSAVHGDSVETPHRTIIARSMRSMLVCCCPCCSPGLTTFGEPWSGLPKPDQFFPGLRCWLSTFVHMLVSEKT